jgi:hypothetical protein
MFISVLGKVDTGFELALFEVLNPQGLFERFELPALLKSFDFTARSI